MLGRGKHKQGTQGELVAFNQDLSDWDAFLADWPVERLGTMSLAEYATVADKRCFTYRVERELDGYGGMRGGTALKFGIYAHRLGDSDDKKLDNVTYSPQYAWYSRFGNDPDRVFHNVRNEILAIAEAAGRGDFSHLDASTDDGLLWPVYRSKLAFLYQGRDQPRLLAVLSPPSLRKFLGMPASDRMPTTQLHATVLRQRSPDESLMAFSERVWEAVKPTGDYVITLTQGAINAPNHYLPIHDLPNSPFPKAMIGDDSGAKPGTEAIFRTDNGLEFSSDIRSPGGKSGRLRTRMARYYDAIQPSAGDQIRVDPLDDGSYQLTHIPKHGSPNAATPTLMTAPKPIKPAMTNSQPLNQILYGPPGTGKTYCTIDKAVSILDPAFYASEGSTRDRLKKRFDELVHDGLIRFVTFHQSFSYEDFVEGIRADSEGGSLQYRVEPGIFRNLCEDARGSAQIASDVGVREGARIWKISIDGTGLAGTTRNHCFVHGEARIGWSQVGDLMNENLAELPAYAVLGSNDRSSLHGFSREIEPGDVLLCIGSENEFQAVGVVQGDYEYQAEPPAGVRSDYVNVLPVNWLATGLSLDIRALNGGRKFTLKTVYELTRFDWPELAEYLEAASVQLAGTTNSLTKESPPHVLIIDEINRGNISRIFGELITLIEPSKRKGRPEALEVVLPYSKKRFSVPDNVYLVGTMNTADRSLAGLDIALRRRFVFEEMPPKPEMLKSVGNIDLHKLLTTMNQRIEVLLGRDYLLGHAYFVDVESMVDLKQVFQRQVLPLLQEYFFEDWEKIALVLNDHRKVPANRFLIQPASNLQSLFGKEGVASPNPLWNINPDAFEHADSYLGIYTAIGPAA